MLVSRERIVWNLACAVVVLLVAAPHAAQAQDQAPAGDADELSRQATDPTASLMAFNFINDFRTSFTDSDDTGFEFRFQPVVPFRAFKTSNILRVVVPYQGSGPGNEGLKDVSIFDLVVLPQKWGRLGIGPVMSLKQSAGDAPSKFAIGPAVGWSEADVAEAEHRRSSRRTCSPARWRSASCSRSSRISWGTGGRSAPATCSSPTTGKTADGCRSRSDSSWGSCGRSAASRSACR